MADEGTEPAVAPAEAPVAEAPAPKVQTAYEVMVHALHQGRVTVTKAQLAALRADGSLTKGNGNHRAEFEQAVVQNDIYVEDR